MILSDTIARHRHVWCFGCSFTSWQWPTWADLLQKKYGNVTNLGKSGAGNVYIFTKIMEKYTQGHITEDDLVMVCWSGHYRLDMKFKGQWITKGNLLTQDVYSMDFVKKYCDPQYFLERDLYLVHAVNEIFKGRIINFSMADIDQLDQYNNIHVRLDKQDHVQKTLDTFFPSFYKVLWNNDFETIRDRDDRHPTETEHATYLEKVFKEKI
jgi:hypothetical protein